MELPGGRPWRTSPFMNLADDDVRVLARIYAGGYGDGPWLIYSSADENRPTVSHMRALDGLGLVELLDEKAAGWVDGMWGGRLTCLGANAVFRTETPHRHPDCGTWSPDGTCTRCRSRRPLDRDAYCAYLDALEAHDREHETSGPRLWCVEHGRLRRADVTTTKMCRLPGTHLHDGWTYRI